MLAAERGAATNTLDAYRRDLEGAEELAGDLVAADRAALGGIVRAIVMGHAVEHEGVAAYLQRLPRHQRDLALDVHRLY